MVRRQNKAGCRRRVVMHHFAGGGPAIFQQCGVLGQGDDPPFKQRLAGQCLFKMDRIAHFLQRPFFRHSAGFLLPSLRQMRFVVNDEIRPGAGIPAGILKFL